ncbi:MAG: RnfABCDGE type electron transport complex subunit G [Lachnospiraceae bacterium]|nr:RnfABCDGE type electron transport complex subunit G [Lachnospiraceae bacterium]
MKENIRSIITLTLITLIAGVLLGYVYELTKEPIAARTLEAKLDAYHKVFPEASDFKEDQSIDLDTSTNVLDAAGYSKETVDECLVAVDSSGNMLGHVLSVTTSEGYGGDIRISMGVGNDGILKGIEILSISETAGLGMKADTDEFKSQFTDKNVSKFSYTKTGATADYEIDALSGATITTNAMVNAVNAGLEYASGLSVK